MSDLATSLESYLGHLASAMNASDPLPHPYTQIAHFVTRATVVCF